MRHAFVYLIAHFLVVASGSPLMAASLETQLIADARDGKLDRWSLLEASLIASGCTEKATLTACNNRFQRTLARLKNNSSVKTPQEALVQMHHVWLTGRFKDHCNDMRVTLQTGNYNCVTSTALFLVLTTHWNIPCQAMSRPKHVFAADAAGTWIETTNPRAARPANKRSARNLSEIQLLAKFFYNRGIAAYHQRSFEEAQRLFQISRMMDPHDPLATQNLIASYNAAALHRCDGGDFRQATETIAQGLTVAPGYRPLLSNDLHIRHLWAIQLAKTKKFHRAIQVVRQAKLTAADPFAKRALLILFRDWTQHELQSNRWEQALRAIKMARRSFPDDARQATMEKAAIRRAIRHLRANGKENEASKLLQSIEQHLGSSAKSLAL